MMNTENDNKSEPTAAEIVQATKELPEAATKQLAEQEEAHKKHTEEVNRRIKSGIRKGTGRIV